MTDFVALRYYRLFTRRPYLRVDGSELVVRIPGLFGARARWRIPLSTIAVVDSAASVEDESGEGWVFVEPLRVPYAYTTTNNVSSNLTLYFKEPQRVPRVSLLGMFGQFTVPFRASRSDAGYTVNGMTLRAEDPAAAVDILVAAGVERIDRPAAWLHSHYQTTTNPEAVHVAEVNARRATWVVWAAFAAAIVLASLRLFEHELSSTWIFVIVGGGFVVVFGLPFWAIKRAARDRARL